MKRLCPRYTYAWPVPPTGFSFLHPFDSSTCVDVHSFLFGFFSAFIMKLIFILSAALMATVSAKPCKRVNSTLVPSPSNPSPNGVSFLEKAPAKADVTTEENNSPIPVAFGTSTTASVPAAQTSSAAAAASIEPETPSGGLPTANTSLSSATGPSTKGTITCPAGFLNVVFNTDANNEDGVNLDARFATLQKYGANGWSRLCPLPIECLLIPL